MSRKEVGFLPLTLSLSLQLWKGIHPTHTHTHTHTHTLERDLGPDRPQDTLPHGAAPLAHPWPPYSPVWAGLCH